ncbi:putative transporter [Halomicronema hongdechloris C2206]|uniref:Transporter n=1 Tax=Halomicronema hongdechloris C2206 TaxID=1641165 RepID=A0A1Z3HFX8_9CYAN|nr:SLC13 family permease [Halomicronema hongdechloris]ASC69155.1 putative transporter [Halomicronema hongdechloris C2206]
MTADIVLTLAIAALALLLFMLEWLPADITGMVVMVTLMLLGQVTPRKGFWASAIQPPLTVMAMFILSAGIARTGALQRLNQALIAWSGKQAQTDAALGCDPGPLSGVIKNPPSSQCCWPTVEDLCRRQGFSASRLLMPWSFITILGGMLTVVGTSTTVLASGLSGQLGYGEFDLLCCDGPGGDCLGIGLAYLIFVPAAADHKQSHTSFSQEYDLRGYVSEVVITPRSSLVGQTLRASELQRRFDLDVLELIHNESLRPALADKVLSAGDILLVRCGRGDLLKIRDSEGLEILPDVQFGQKSWQADLSSGEEGIAEVLVLANSNLIGSTLKEMRFRQRYNVTVLAIRRGEELVRDRLGKVPLRFGDLLLVQGPKQSFVGLQTSRDLLVLEQRDLETLRSQKAPIAILIGLGVVVLAALNQVPILVAALTGSVLMVLSGCLKPGELYQSIRWDVIFLLASLIPLGISMETSGATDWLATNLVALGQHLSPHGLLMVLFVLTTVLTGILSNTAAVILLLPVGVQIAETLDLNPFTVMAVITFAASNSFMTPIGYQTNTMVYGAGGYRFLDFVRVGGPLCLVMALVIPSLAGWLYGL